MTRHYITQNLKFKGQSHSLKPRNHPSSFGFLVTALSFKLYPLNLIISLFNEIVDVDHTFDFFLNGRCIVHAVIRNII